MDTNELKRLVALLPENIDTLEGISDEAWRKSILNLVISQWSGEIEELGVYANEPKLGRWCRVSNFILGDPKYLDTRDRYTLEDLLPFLIEMVFTNGWLENIGHLIYMCTVVYKDSSPLLRLVKCEGDIIMDYWEDEDIFSLYVKGRECKFLNPLPWESCLELVRAMESSTTGIDSSKVWSLYSPEEWTDEHIRELINKGCKEEFFVEALWRDLDISPEFNQVKSMETIKEVVREWHGLSEWQRELAYIHMRMSIRHCVPIDSLPIVLSPLNIALLEHGVVDGNVFDKDVETLVVPHD